ncbi:MAG: TIGR03663 family protein [Thermoanaerobaculia bacterium]|nr:TIGR03663 family protein [Thermoanaerobaculia bacterium]
MSRLDRWGLSRYVLTWAAILVVAVLLRIPGLGDRAMSHDESQHAYYAWALSEGGGYVHQPLLHGPLLFHLTGLLFFVGGASETLARVYPAAAGLLLVLAPLALKRWLGRRGALAAAALIALSPSLTFYSRYLRNDVPLALFAIVWLGAAYAWVEDRRRRWLWLMVAGMAASFASKETAFLTGLIVGLWALFVAWRGRSREQRSAAATLAVLLLTLVAPYFSGLVATIRHPDAATLWTSGDLVVALGLALGAALVARWWARWLAKREGDSPNFDFATWRRLAGCFWGIQLVLLTAFLTRPAGVGSGVVGSLRYWLEQHGVERGGQPLFYYGMLGGLYEALPILLAVCAVIGWLRRSRRGSRKHGPTFVGFLVWWATGSLVLYSAAGEKMPWLLVHILLPTILLGGWWLGQFAPSLERLRAVPGQTLAVAASGPTVLFLAWRCLTLTPFSGKSPEAVTETLTWSVQLFLLAYIVRFLLRSAARQGRSTLRWATLGVLAFAGLLTLRTTVHLCFRNQDLAVEPLVYAHGTAELASTLRELDRWGPGLPPPLFLDREATWPVLWYLRDRPNRFVLSETLTPSLRHAPIVLVGEGRRETVRRLLQESHSEHTVRLLWWPLEDYRYLDSSSVFEWLTDPDRRRRLWRIVLYRRYLVDPRLWPMDSELSVFVAKGLDSTSEPP